MNIHKYLTSILGCHEAEMHAQEALDSAKRSKTYWDKAAGQTNDAVRAADKAKGHADSSRFYAILNTILTIIVITSIMIFAFTGGA